MNDGLIFVNTILSGFPETMRPWVALAIAVVFGVCVVAWIARKRGYWLSPKRARIELKLNHIFNQRTVLSEENIYENPLAYDYDGGMLFFVFFNREFAVNHCRVKRNREDITANVAYQVRWNRLAVLHLPYMDHGDLLELEFFAKGAS